MTTKTRKPPCPGWTMQHNFWCSWDGERYVGYCTECGATAEYDATLGVGRTELREGSYKARTKEELQHEDSADTR